MFLCCCCCCCPCWSADRMTGSRIKKQFTSVHGLQTFAGDVRLQLSSGCRNAPLCPSTSILEPAQDSLPVGLLLARRNSALYAQTSLPATGSSAAIRCLPRVGRDFFYHLRLVIAFNPLLALPEDVSTRPYNSHPHTTTRPFLLNPDILQDGCRQDHQKVRGWFPSPSFLQVPVPRQRR